MKYVAWDLESTASRPDKGAIVEFGAVYDNLENIKPIDELPSFHCYVLPSRNSTLGGYNGEEFALELNKEIIQRIIRRDEGYQYLYPDEVAPAFARWLLNLKDPVSRYGNPFYRSKKHENKIMFNSAGKNLGSFDIPWVEYHLNGWRDQFITMMPIIDPAILWYEKGDYKLPNSQICMDRAGLKGEVAHDAVSDSKMVCELVRLKLVDGYELNPFQYGSENPQEVNA